MASVEYWQWNSRKMSWKWANIATKAEGKQNLHVEEVFREVLVLLSHTWITSGNNVWGGAGAGEEKGWLQVRLSRRDYEKQPKRRECLIGTEAVHLQQEGGRNAGYSHPLITNLGIERLLYPPLLPLPSPLFFFGNTGVWTQDLALARQVLFHSNHTLSSFCFHYFSGRVSYFCWPHTVILLPMPPK
jgi:hypothetical protein